MSTLQERLAQAMAPPCTVTAADLARACKVKPPSVHEWIHGPTKSLRSTHAVRVAHELGVNFEWLTTGRGPMRGNSDATDKSVSSPYLGREVMEHLEALGVSQGLLVKVLAESIPAAGKAFLSELRKADPHVRRLEHVKVLRAALEKEFPSQAQQSQRTASRKPGGAARQK